MELKDNGMELKDNRSPRILGQVLAVHWHRKIMADLTGKGKVDRLPVIVSGESIEEILAIPRISSGTDIAQSDAHRKLKWFMHYRILVRMVR